MIVSEIFSIFRLQRQDLNSNQYLFTDNELYTYLNEAQDEACKRARLLVSTDPSVGETKSKSTIEIIGNNGNISELLINNINIISNTINYTTSADVTANLLSNEINNTGLYESTVLNNVVTLIPLDGIGEDLNNIYPIVTGTLLTNTTSFIGGINGICKLNLKINQSICNYSNKILNIKSAYLTSKNKKLKLIDYRELDERCYNWQSQTGEPCSLLFGLNSNKFNVYKKTTKKDGILLHVNHLPINKLVNYDDVPEINESYHIKLVDWMLYKSYLKEDSEVNNIDIANMYLNNFISQFGDDFTSNAAYDAFRRNTSLVDNGDY